MALWCFLWQVMLMFLVLRCASAGAINNRPIIGILTEPLGHELAATASDAGVARSPVGEGHDLAGRSMLAASYVKFAESAGARVVPIHFDATDDELRSLFGQINGIIFPGGGVNLSASPDNKFRQSAQLLYDLALEANNRGDPFPIHGTCLGFQLLTLLTARNDSVLCRRCFKAEGLPLPLDFTAAARSSRLFSRMPEFLFSALGSENITENSHGGGVEPDQYSENVNLREFYTVLSTNADLNGRRFVSTIEAKKYPITATQWHPEKSNFEWGGIGALSEAAIPHSEDAIMVSQYMANNFVAHARRSSHRFSPTGAAEAALIYTDAVVKDASGYFEQVYLWEGRHVASSQIDPVTVLI